MLYSKGIYPLSKTIFANSRSHRCFKSSGCRFYLLIKKPSRKKISSHGCHTIHIFYFTRWPAWYKEVKLWGKAMKNQVPLAMRWLPLSLFSTLKETCVLPLPRNSISKFQSKIYMVWKKCMCNGLSDKWFFYRHHKHKKQFLVV